MLRQLIRRAALGIACWLLLASLPATLGAQGLPPTNVTVLASGAGASVAWSPIRMEGMTYRVLRGLNGKEPGTDLTRPVTAGPFLDPTPVAGTTYYYQVIAIYGDGSTGAATPVMFTAPKPTTVTAVEPTTTLITQPVALAPTSTTTRTLLATPTAVSGVTVSGTTASATVSWQPVLGAAGYTVTRTTPDANPPRSFPGLTTTSWKDDGPAGIGFVVAGTYGYQVTATLPTGATVSGQVNWTRPDPTCAAPISTQPMLTVLDPTASASLFTSYGPLPNGGAFDWTKPKSSGVIAYRMERAVQGSNAWTLVGTTCGGPIRIAMQSVSSAAYMRWVDSLPAVVPGTVMLYRVTALAANGEAGAGTKSWTAPTMVAPHWLGVTVAGSTVTLRWRYDPPATNAPTLPTVYKLSAPYGFTRTWYEGCEKLAGCTAMINAVPSGTHHFTLIAGWTLSTNLRSDSPVLARMSADTTVTVP